MAKELGPGRNSLESEQRQILEAQGSQQLEFGSWKAQQARLDPVEELRVSSQDWGREAEAPPCDFTDSVLVRPCQPLSEPQLGVLAVSMSLSRMKTRSVGD